MAHKKKNKSFSFKNMLGSFAADLLLGAFKEQILDLVQDAADRIHQGIVNAGKLVANLLFSGIIVLTGFFMLIISFVLLTQEIFKFSLGLSLFIWSVILILFGFIYALLITNKKERN